jgi:hypothetical protein
MAAKPSMGRRGELGRKTLTQRARSLSAEFAEGIVATVFGLRRSRAMRKRWTESVIQRAMSMSGM